MKTRITHSFSTRISLYILLAAGTIFLIAFIIFYHSARNLVQKEAEEHGETSLSNTILQIDDVLHSVEVAVRNTAWLIPEHLDEPETMYAIVQRLLEQNPIISGSAIAFEPDFFPREGKFYAPYAYRQEEQIVCKQLGTENYDYHYMDWYQIPKLLNCPYWSEPYLDTGGGEMMMTTYSLPLYDSAGNLYAVFTADISLEWLTQKVNSLHVYPHSYNLMIGRSGTYLVHPYPERILNETIFTATLDMEDQTVAEVGRKMIAGKQGFETIFNDDSLSTSYVFYAPVLRTGWSMAVVCTYKDVFADVDQIRTVVLSVALAGMCLLLFFCIYIIRQLTSPLTKLADATREIAKGDFTSPLPPIRQKNDELGKLYDAFAHMQHSLVDYIRELKTTTANKERIESELRIAREIQMGMIPKIFPPFPDREDIDLYATLKPAKEVGGDLYDFFIEGDVLYFTIGDVSGKGVPASLLMAVTRSLFRNMAPHVQEASRIAGSLNNSISASNESSMFVTLFVGILDLKTGRLRYCNAGHNAPLFLSSGKAEWLPVLPNLPLGLLEGFGYREQEIVLPGDATLFLYTDGVTESENTAKELFSEDRLIEFLEKQIHEAPTGLVNGMMSEIDKHAAGAEQSDDITMLCLRYTSNSL